jgi:penicillin-binding protein 1A
MAAAYSVFAARGMQFPASPVLRVLGPDGQVLEDNTKRQGKRVLAENIADQMNQALGGVIQHGTGTAADLGRPNGEAGKTGTSENFSDAWFVGYTPELSTAIWMGYSDSQKPLVNVKGLPRVYGGTLPAKTWHDYMTAALDGKPATDFPPPAAPTPVTVAPSASVAPGPRVVTPTTTPYVPPVPVEPAPLPPYVYQPPYYPIPDYTQPSVPDQVYVPPPVVTVPPPPPLTGGAGTDFQPPQYVPGVR